MGRRRHSPLVRGLAESRARGDDAADLAPLLIPGPLQTTDYARALFLGGLLNPSEDAIDQPVAARLARQSIFDRPDPPNLWIVLDEVVLHRLIGTPKTMYDQLLQVADMSMRSYICVQVVPASTGAHAGLAGFVLYRQRARASRTFSTWMPSKA